MRIPDVASETRITFGGGAGIKFKAGASASVFLEGRYLTINTSGSNANFIPITLGVSFGLKQVVLRPGHMRGGLQARPSAFPHWPGVVALTCPSMISFACFAPGPAVRVAQSDPSRQEPAVTDHTHAGARKHLAERLDRARDLYLLALALGARGDGTTVFGRMIREARIHFIAVIEECRIAGLDTSANRTDPRQGEQGAGGQHQTRDVEAAGAGHRPPGAEGRVSAGG